MTSTTSLTSGPGRGPGRATLLSFVLSVCLWTASAAAQGISPGWSDLYGNGLDCQWIDVTDVPPGKYELRVDLNPSRTFQELTFDNNSASVEVTVP